MDAPALLALSLGASVAVAGVGWIGGRIVERASSDPALRDRMWGAVLCLPAMPVVVTGLLLLAPAPIREAVLDRTGASTLAVAPLIQAGGHPATVLGLDASWAVLAAAGALALARLCGLGLRTWRLARMIRRAEAPDARTAALVENVARVMSVRRPRVSVTAATTDALLSGLGSARLVLADRMMRSGPDVLKAVIAHEIAHLKRGDHRGFWLEEGLMALLAVNPLMPVLRARRAAAREEACDALALAQADGETRRAYALFLIEALRSRAGPHAGALPALTFTGAGRTIAMHRLKAVLIPAHPAGRRVRLAATAVGCALVAAVAAGSVAIAGQGDPAAAAPVAPSGRAPRVGPTLYLTPLAPGDARNASPSRGEALTPTPGMGAPLYLTPLPTRRAGEAAPVGAGLTPAPVR